MINLDDEEAVGRIFAEQIEPRLYELNEQREAALQESRDRWKKSLVLGIVPAAFLSFAIAFYLFKLGMMWAVSVCIVTIVIGTVCARHYANQSSTAYESELRERFMTQVCTVLGDLRYSRVGTSFDIRKFKEYKVIPGYQTAELEDLLEGTHNGHAFSIVEAKLTKTTTSHDDESSHTDTETVFEGLLLKLSSPLRSTGRILIAKDRGKIINKLSGIVRRGKRVEIPNAEFEEMYEVTADNPDETLSLLTPSVVALFVHLPEILDARHLSIGIEGNDILISASDTKPFIEGFSVQLDTLHYRHLFEDVVRECKIAANIIDRLAESSR